MRLLVLSLLMVLPRCSFAADKPNILIAISDDQSFGHASAYGCTFINTPAFDKVAKEGILFTNAYAASPGCSPCRAALLTGRHIWQIEHAGTHASSFPAKYRAYPEVLGENGYWVGYTGKGWGPGNFKVDGRIENPAGPAFSSKKTKAPHSGISSTDYSANFADFLKQKPADQPFCFWYGGHEPHRGFEQGAGLKAGKKLEDAQVPGFLPDRPEIRSDLLDYAVEIEWFDRHLGQIIEQLEAAGELENTLLIVTSDNGMSFPRAKANCYDAGIHMPLAMRWGGINPPGRTCDALVGFVDLTRTIYEVTGVTHPSEDYPLAGHSLQDIFQSATSNASDAKRTAVYSGRERHSSSRYQNLAYPQRSIRSGDYLLIKNFRPERWPAGPGQKLMKNGEPGPLHDGYHDIDACPSLTYLIAQRDDPELGKYFHWAIDHRPQIELFNLQTDPDCLNNLAGTEENSATEIQLTTQLQNYLNETGDPRELNGGDIFETYPRYSSIREFPKPETR